MFEEMLKSSSTSVTVKKRGRLIAGLTSLSRGIHSTFRSTIQSILQLANRQDLVANDKRDKNQQMKSSLDEPRFLTTSFEKVSVDKGKTGHLPTQNGSESSAELIIAPKRSRLAAVSDNLSLTPTNVEKTTSPTIHTVTIDSGFDQSSGVEIRDIILKKTAQQLATKRHFEYHQKKRKEFKRFFKIYAKLLDSIPEEKAMVRLSPEKMKAREIYYIYVFDKCTSPRKAKKNKKSSSRASISEQQQSPSKTHTASPTTLLTHGQKANVHRGRLRSRVTPSNKRWGAVPFSLQPFVEIEVDNPFANYFFENYPNLAKAKRVISSFKGMPYWRHIKTPTRRYETIQPSLLINNPKLTVQKDQTSYHANVTYDDASLSQDDLTPPCVFTKIPHPEHITPVKLASANGGVFKDLVGRIFTPTKVVPSPNDDSFKEMSTSPKNVSFRIRLSQLFSSKAQKQQQAIKSSPPTTHKNQLSEISKECSQAKSKQLMTLKKMNRRNKPVVTSKTRIHDLPLVMYPSQL